MTPLESAFLTDFSEFSDQPTEEVSLLRPCIRSDNSIALFLAALLLPSCASLSRSRVEVRTVPAGAEVRTIAGEVLGKTPLVLEADALDKARRNGRLAVRVENPGYVSRELDLEVHGENLHELELSKLDD